MSGAGYGYELLIRRSGPDIKLVFLGDPVRLETMEAVYDELRKALPSSVKFRRRK